MHWAARSGCAICAALMLGACVSTVAPGALDFHSFTSARGEPTTLGCTSGADSAQRAAAAMTTLDSGFAGLEQQIRARTEATVSDGAEFSGRDMIRLSQRTGLALAQRIEAEQGCYLQR